MKVLDASARMSCARDDLAMAGFRLAAAAQWTGRSWSLSCGGRPYVQQKGTLELARRGRRYGEPMTAAETTSGAPRGVPDQLLIGASPSAIVAHLFPEDLDRFKLEYEAALDEARRAYDLAAVYRVVEHWRRIAALQTDPAGFRDSVRSLAELATGEPIPAGEPFAVTRQKAGL